MSKTDKMYYRSDKKIKLLGITILEIIEDTTRYDGNGEFVTETVPNSEYFDKEFRINKSKKNE